jgi:hypothetical protein
MSILSYLDALPSRLDPYLKDTNKHKLLQHHLY